jgi:hypothetical protein
MSYELVDLGDNVAALNAINASGETAGSSLPGPFATLWSPGGIETVLHTTLGASEAVAIKGPRR